mmetsp:Transcript_5306/g.12205  ORF Transcript_5306/g.12205 Transcript_5306/m.12205 type:complete len:229 (+) Transcript_5306:600-1286(+)
MLPADAVHVDAHASQHLGRVSKVVAHVARQVEIEHIRVQAASAAPKRLGESGAARRADGEGVGARPLAPPPPTLAIARRVALREPQTVDEEDVRAACRVEGAQRIRVPSEGRFGVFDRNTLGPVLARALVEEGPRHDGAAERARRIVRRWRLDRVLHKHQPVPVVPVGLALVANKGVDALRRQSARRVQARQDDHLQVGVAQRAQRHKRRLARVDGTHERQIGNREVD